MAVANQPLMFRGRQRRITLAPSHLRREVKKYERPRLFYVYMGIYGLTGSGRRTLAYRFRNMERGVIQDGDVIAQYYYRTTLQGRFPYDHRNYPSRLYIIKLAVFIIPPPREIMSLIPPIFWMYWDEFCCLALAFDVSNRASYRGLEMSVSMYLEAQNIIPGYRLPDRLLVGNKRDRRNEQPTNPEYLFVGRREARRKAQNLGISYFEVSAKHNRYVDNLLAFIETFAIDSLE